MAALRVLITGVASPLAARLAQTLADEGHRVVGIDTRRPPDALAGRIELVGADLPKGGLGPLLRRVEPDVIVHHDIVQWAEPGRAARSLHDLNVIGTLQLLSACADLPRLRGLVVRSSAAIYGAWAGAPSFFTEDLAREGLDHGPSTRFQRDVGELERLVDAFARRHPAVTCTVLRLQPVIGSATDNQLTRLLRSPVIPTFLGFDPRVQILHADDAVGAVAAAVRRPVPGAVNVAADGTVSLVRTIRRLGKRPLPIAAPLFGPAVEAMARVGTIPRLDGDVVRYLRYGRGVDTTRMRCDLRFAPQYTTAEAIDAVAATLRGAAAA